MRGDDMGVGHVHERWGRTEGWRNPSGVGECGQECGKREPCVVDGRLGCELMAASECWGDAAFFFKYFDSFF